MVKPKLNTDTGNANHEIVSTNESQSETKNIEQSDPGFLQRILSTVPLIEPSFEIIQSTDGSIQLRAEDLCSMEGIVVVSNPSDGKNGVWEVIPAKSDTGCSSITHFIAANSAINCTCKPGESQQFEEAIDVGKSSANANSIPIVYISNELKGTTAPLDAPFWAKKLIDCEELGNSYRGWVHNETDLFIVLRAHKKQTKSIWGTRQSPSSNCLSQRLMWKSQYVPFDGIPFVNHGSRAIVMECQYGPRRKRNIPPKKQLSSAPKRAYTQTCPARIYVKKVQKYLEFVVDTTLEKKKMRLAMDQAFQNLKTKGFDGHGETRWYVQLPTEAAHRYHESGTNTEMSPESSVNNDRMDTNLTVHPCIVSKINDLVRNGEGRVYAIRKQLRKFVEKEMNHEGQKIPERHNLVYFPTVNDIRNYVYQALQDIQSGKLPLFVQSVILDPMADKRLPNLETSNNFDNALSEELPENLPDGRERLAEISENQTQEAKNQAMSVTITFTQPKEGILPVISRVETKMQDGSVHISMTLTPQSTKLLSKVTPDIFTSNGIQVSAAVNEALEAISEEGT